MDNGFIAHQVQFTVGQRRLVDDISLTLPPGEMVALIGPNGAGKSTLLRLLTGFLTPSRGVCSLAGKSLAAWPSQALSRYRAVMLQHHALGVEWAAESVVAMGRAPWGERHACDIVRKVMRLTGCETLIGRRFSTLSGGEQQRVQLARSLAQLWRNGAPEGWLFLDEPTSALDLYHQQQLLRLLKSLTQRARLHVCVVLHDLNLAALWADRIVLLHKGKLVVEGTPQQVLQPEVIARWYGAQVHVATHPDGQTPQVFLCV
ncbi:heme ABC transporter ATP-binding protein [Kosakonia sp. S58]|uniref:heme ABC transporter ATP-binding protein n=1 Tax=unclassified Kosakonia TaxID=2632876 RepID=UPI0019030753|nr:MULTISPECIES: heme ABC transporter ATP-binding protein [unclassified Kosakonia]MBK0081731.1 heme ABC transporter ATP-binding protein [Kosakonia sp. S57]MBK0088169.1 heme ABC transporter ATP-binding protein [Kosakonia sp. S58]